MLSTLTLAVVVVTAICTPPRFVREPSMAIHVRIDQPGGLPTDDLLRVIQEVRGIWGPVGVSITSGGYADPVPPWQAVMSLRVVAEQWTRNGRPVLGWVIAPSHPQQVPILFISRSAVRDLLASEHVRGTPLRRLPRGMADRLTAQAIGRVVAHELGHYLLRSADHADGGLMRPHYSAGDLIAPWIKLFQLPANDWAAARRAVAYITETQTR